MAGSAQASLIVRSINLAMVESDFKPRQELRGNMPDERAFFRSLLREFLPAYNNPDTLICE